jgi:hypothetical protein
MCSSGSITEDLLTAKHQEDRCDLCEVIPEVQVGGWRWRSRWRSRWRWSWCWVRCSRLCCT